MKLESFTATADLVGERIRLRWAFVAELGETVAIAPQVTVRRKTRDFDFPDAGTPDPFLLYDSQHFPPAPVAGALVVNDLPDVDRTDGPRRVREQTVTVAEIVGGKLREVLRRTVRTVFAADRSVLRREVELLDVGGAGAKLTAGVPYYYRLGGPGLSADPARYQVTSTAGGAHGHNRTLYNLIPEVYRRHDTIRRAPDAGTGLLPEASTVGGQLRRFVDVFGAALDGIRSSAEGLRSLRDPAEVDHRFLPMLAQWIGWDLTADRDVAQQRNEIRNAPRLYDAVGTMPGLRSVVDYYTGLSTRVTEFAQHITRAGVGPQRNLFAAVQRTSGWWGTDEAAAVLGFTPPNDRSAGAAGTSASLTGTVTQPFALRPGMTMTLAVDGGLPVAITFGKADFADIGAAKAAEVAAVLARAIGELRAGDTAGAVQLRSLLTGATSKIQVVTAPASLVSLDGAPEGRLATGTDTSGRAWLAHASTAGAGGVLPRLQLKAALRGGWYDTQQVIDQQVAPAAEPALACLPDGRLWLTWVDHPGTAKSRLRWRLGLPAPMTPARLRGDVVAPFRLVAGTVLTLTGYGFTEVFTVRAADYGGVGAATAAEVVAAMNSQLTQVTAAATPDGSLALASRASGPDVALRVQLSASTAARVLGFGDRHLAGRGGWEPQVGWAPVADAGPVPSGRHADCAAVLDSDGAVRLSWSTHLDDAWRVARARWDGRLLVPTSTGLGVLGTDGRWSTLAAGADVRGVAADADGSLWSATAAGAAMRRPDGSTTVLTKASTSGGLAHDDVRAVAVAQNGFVWFAHAAGASARRPDGTWQQVTASAGGLASNDVRHVLVDGRSAVWFLTAAGVSVLSGTGWHTVRAADGLRSEDVRHGIVTLDGVVWVATAAGLATITPEGVVTPIDLVAAGAGPSAANDTRGITAASAPSTSDAEAGTSGTVWIATGAGLVELVSSREARLHTVAEGVPSVDCRAVSVTPDGVVWVGTPAGLGRRDTTGAWRTVTTTDGLPGNLVRSLHGPWSAPQWFEGTPAGERDPHLLRDGTRLWLSTARRLAVGDPDDRWQLVLRHWDSAAQAWSPPLAVTPGAATDREPVGVPLTGGGLRLYFRSDRGGGERLWSVDVDAAGTPGTPAAVTSGTATDGNPAALTQSGGETWLLFRSDRNVALGRLGGGVPGSADEAVSRRAPEEASLRRFAGSVTATPADLTRNRAAGQFGDLLDYTPQQPGGEPAADDELYTPGTIGLYVSQGPSGRPVGDLDTDRLRQLLDRFLPVNLRAVILPRSGEQTAAVHLQSDNRGAVHGQDVS